MSRLNYTQRGKWRTESDNSKSETPIIRHVAGAMSYRLHRDEQIPVTCLMVFKESVLWKRIPRCRCWQKPRRKKPGRTWEEEGKEGNLIQLSGELRGPIYYGSRAATYCHINLKMIGSLRSWLIGLIWRRSRKYDSSSGDNHSCQLL